MLAQLVLGLPVFPSRSRLRLTMILLHLLGVVVFDALPATRYRLLAVLLFPIEEVADAPLESLHAAQEPVVLLFIQTSVGFFRRQISLYPRMVVVVVSRI